MGEITFTGEPPYSLPVAQSAGARALDTTVEVTLTVNVPDKLPPLVPVRIQLTVPVAQTLAVQIESAIPNAQAAGREKGTFRTKGNRE